MTLPYGLSFPCCAAGSLSVLKGSGLQDSCSEFSKMFVLDRAQIAIRRSSHRKLQTDADAQTDFHGVMFVLCPAFTSRATRRRGMEKHIAHLLAAFHSVSTHSLHQKKKKKTSQLQARSDTASG